MSRLPGIIGITGPKRSGKDTLARLLVERWGYRREAFADEVKRFALIIDPIVETYHTQGGFLGATPRIERLSAVIERHGWEHAKDTYPEVRRFLVALGTNVFRREVDDQFWVRRVLERERAGYLVIPDVRFDNEAEAVRTRGGIVLELRRPGYERDPADPAEAGVSPNLVHRVVFNDRAPGDLLWKADEALQSINLTF